MEPLQIMSEWMPNGILTKYIENTPRADRIGLVSLPPANALDR